LFLVQKCVEDIYKIASRVLYIIVTKCILMCELKTGEIFHYSEL